MGLCASVPCAKGDPTANADVVPVENGADGPVVTKEWVETALKSGGALPAEGWSIEDVIVEKMMVANLEGTAEKEDGGGISGPKVLKMEIVYGEGAPAELPTRVVLKWGSLVHFSTYAFAIRLYLWYANVRLEEMLRCESSVYENAATLIKETGIRMPKCYYQGSSYPQDSAGNPSDSGACCFVCCGRRTAVRTVQIMEDLYAAGYESGPIAEGVSAERFKAMLSNIAKLHAWGWGKRDDLPLPNLWYQSPVECGVVGRMPRQLSAKSSFGDGSAARKFVETWAEHESLMLGGGRSNMFKTNPEYIQILQAVVDGAAVWEPKAAALWPAQDQPKPIGSTILHGDAHQWNHMFRAQQEGSSTPPDPNDLVVIDWQATGGGHLSTEVFYMLIQAYDFRTLEDDMVMLRHYHAALTAALQAGGVADGYTFEVFYEHFCLTVLDTVAQTAVLYSKFVDPALSQKMEQDEKQRELVIVGSTVRGRIFARVEGHILGNPETRVAMLGTTGELDASEEAPETAALVAGRVYASEEAAETAALVAGRV